jgi:hypothetical protein
MTARNDGARSRCLTPISSSPDHVAHAAPTRPVGVLSSRPDRAAPTQGSRRPDASVGPAHALGAKCARADAPRALLRPVLARAGAAARSVRHGSDNRVGGPHGVFDRRVGSTLHVRPSWLSSECASRSAQHAQPRPSRASWMILQGGDLRRSSDGSGADPGSRPGVEGQVGRGRFCDDYRRLDGPDYGEYCFARVDNGALASLGFGSATSEVTSTASNSEMGTFALIQARSASFHSGLGLPEIPTDPIPFSVPFDSM